MHFEPMLAAGNDWVVAVFTIIIPVGIWILNQVFGQLNKAGERQTAKRIAPPPGTPAPEDEVQEFLQRVRERRDESKSIQVLKPEQQSNGNRQKGSGERGKGERARRERGGKNRSTSSPPLPSERSGSSAAPTQRKPFGSQLSEQVARDIDTSDVTERSHLLTKLDQADEQMEAHIQSAFTHKLGRLEVQADETAVAKQAAEDARPPSLAEQIRSQLANPAGLRQAVIMREIIDRPTHRW